MTSFSHSLRDRILWVLANNGGKIERSRLRAATGMRYALLNPVVDELVSEAGSKLLLWRGGGFSIPYKWIERWTRPKERLVASECQPSIDCHFVAFRCSILIFIYDFVIINFNDLIFGFTTL
jgi:hypothetical protein